MIPMCFSIVNIFLLSYLGYLKVKRILTFLKKFLLEKNEEIFSTLYLK